jgi:hypothetical protein
MKTKLIQRLIQLAAIVFLVWLVVRGVRHSDFDLLIMCGIVGAIVFADWLIVKKFRKLPRVVVFSKNWCGFLFHSQFFL